MGEVGRERKEARREQGREIRGGVKFIVQM